MPQVDFKFLRAGPLDAELAIEAIVEVHKRTPVDEHALAAFLANPTCCLIVAACEGRVVGSVNGYALPHPACDRPQFLLFELDVREGWRNRGLGKALITAFVNEARAANACEVWVLTNASNAAAMSLYRACGFERVNTDDVMLSMAL